ncbi:hypothetical protein [Brevundimonas albigilva]|uniref:Uncharacterized protein n=1 Tax=Brevundimonas albigilva TaxID=1312364 RepID=A0ABY4SMV0_9CAUL|nr:hypothetical protein [Brevundimonas albigilva]URI15583.1 hypothetical protein M8231_00880 [Brevundimonas albigilva]
MSFLERAFQRAGDRIMYALGSDEAEGRLRAGVVADKLHKDWAVHRGATNGRKNWKGFVRFMDSQYGVELDPGIFDANTSGEDLDQIIAHVAGQMLQNGQAEFAEF